MQVFKLYLKLLNKYKGQILMYIGIFFAMFFGFVYPNALKEKNKSYEDSKCKFAVYDYDDSPSSNALVDYLEKKHKLVKLSDDKKTTIQDELYSRNIYCAIKIPQGFEESLKAGNIEDIVEILTIPGTTTSQVFEADVNRYLKVLDTYSLAGLDIEQAGEKAANTEVDKVKVTVGNGGEETRNSYSKAHVFFTYQAWIFVVMIITGIAPILNVFDKKEVRDRINISSYKFSRLNSELVLGVLTTGMAIWASFLIIGKLVTGNEISGEKFFYYSLNLFSITCVSLSLAFLVSKITSNSMVIALFANILSLGMAFLCGVFVPMEFLGEGVIKLAHFLPAYWFEKALISLDSVSYKATELFSYIGIQMLFSLVFLCMALVLARKKSVA